MGDVFSAVSDPLRRQLIEQLVDGGPQTATTLAKSHDLTRQAIVRHLTTLLECGVVSSTRHGNEVRYEIQPNALAAATVWMERVAQRWDLRAHALQKQAAGQSASSSKPPRPSSKDSKARPTRQSAK